MATRSMKVLLAFCTSLLFTFSALAQNQTLIHCGVLLDPGVTMEPLPERTLVVENGRIIRVDEGYTEGDSDDQLIDLKDEYVMPGWIDSHTHISGESRKNAYLDRFTLSHPYVALQATQYARTTLLAGFTTIRNVGGYYEVDQGLRDAINRGIIIGPRIFVAGGLAIMGGHGDRTNGAREDIFGIPGIEHGVINGVDEAIKGTRLAIKRGADLVKITATGGVLSIARDGSAPQFFEDEIEAIVAVANGFGLKVAAHAHGDEGMQRAVRAGVSSIEHGTYMSEETMELMKERGTYYVPTITAGRSVADSARIEGYYVPVVTKKALEIGPIIQSTFEKAYKAGVPIAFGTDAGVFKHGRNAFEFIYMKEAGMPVMEIIKSATYNAADLLGQLDNVGTLEPGKYADVVAVPRNPVEDISVMREVSFVMKEGRVYKE